MQMKALSLGTLKIITRLHSKQIAHAYQAMCYSLCRDKSTRLILFMCVSIEYHMMYWFSLETNLYTREQTISVKDLGHTIET